MAGILLKTKPHIELIYGDLVSTKKYWDKMSNVSKKLMVDYLNQYDINREAIYLLYSIGLDEDIKLEIEEFAKVSGFKHVEWVETGALSGPDGFYIAD